MKKFIEGKYFLYLISSVIPLLAVSIFIADLVCSALAIFFLFYVIKNKINFFYKNIFFILSLFFYLISIASSIFSKDILYSLKSSLPFFRVIIFSLLISYIINKNNNFINIIYSIFKITFLVLIFYGLGEYIYKYYLLVELNRLDISNIRLTLFVSDEEKLGSYLVRLFGVYVALYISQKNKSREDNYFFYAITLFISIVILLSGERTSLFFLLMFFVLSFILLNIRFKKKLILLILISSILFLILMLNQNLSNRIIFDKNNQFNFSKDKIILFTPQHTTHYLTALNMFVDKPFLGHGPKMFRKSCSDKNYEVIYDKIYKGCSLHPHNTYFQLLAETGILSAVIFSLGFLHILYNLSKHFFVFVFYKKRIMNDYRIILSLTALIIFWPFSPSGNFFNNWVLILNSIPLGFYVNEFFKNKKKH